MDDFQYLPDFKGWVALIAAGIAGWTLLRSKTAQIWKDERDAALAKAERLTESVKELTAQKANLDSELREYKAKTDLSQVMEQHRMFHTELVGALGAMVAAGDARYEQAMKILETHEQHDRENFATLLAKLEELGKSNASKEQ